MLNLSSLKNFCIIIFTFIFISCLDSNNYYHYLCRMYADPELVDIDVFYKEVMNFWMDRVDTLEEWL